MEYITVCNCENVIKYVSDVYEEKVITCEKCNKQIKIIYNQNGIEVIFEI